MSRHALPVPATLPLLAILASLATGCLEKTPTGIEPASVREIPTQEGSPSPGGPIRIGVVPAASAVVVGSPNAFVVRNKRTGEQLFLGTDGNVTVSLAAPPIVMTTWRLQVVCTPSEADRDRRVAEARAAGYVASFDFAESANCWRVRIGELINATPAQRTAFRDEVIAKGLAGQDSFWTSTTERVADLRIVYGGETVTAPSPVLLEAHGELVRIGGVLYRGKAEVGVNSAGTLAGINELQVEPYLWGVVPRELPPVPFGEPEALKAQAVAARTYALANLNKRGADGYDLLPTTADQVYGGVPAEHPLSTQAVNATAGVVGTHGGRLISALYSSGSGGYTANNEDVFTGTPEAYLRGVLDPLLDLALEPLPTFEGFKNYPSPTNLRSAASIANAPPMTRFYRWFVTWSAAEISAVLSASLARQVGRVWHIDVVDRAGLGRVRRIRYVTEAGTFFAEKDGIRASLKYIDPTGTQVSLLSTLFFIEPVIDAATQEVTGFVAYGGGWGHGVGMSQTGAVSRASKGASYEEILRYYYQGIGLERRY